MFHRRSGPGNASIGGWTAIDDRVRKDNTMTRIIAINTTMCSTVAACGDLGSGETTTSMAARSHGPGNTVRHTVLPPIPIDGQTRLVAVDRAGEQRSSTEAEG